MKYDFLDLGCSNGASIKLGVDKFKGKYGLGIDIDPRKVEMAKEAGYHAVVGDASKLKDVVSSVRFTIMSHFLEHLPGIKLAKSCIESAIDVSSDFIYIQQPYFEADGLLFKRGFKFYWSDWKGHTFHMTALNFHNILRPLLVENRISRFMIFGDQKVTSSSHNSIHSINSPVDQLHYDESKHPIKVIEDFAFPCYRQLIVVIFKKDDLSLYEEVQSKLRYDVRIFDSWLNNTQ